MTDAKGRIRERGKSLEAVIYVGGKKRRLSTGYFVGQEAEAKAMLAETLQLLRAGASAVPASGGSAVRELARAWVENRKAKGKKDWANREAQFRLYLFPSLGDVPVQDVTDAMMMKWAEGLAETKGQRVAELHPHYVRKIARAARMLFKDAVKRGIIARSPCTWDASDLPDASTTSRSVGEGFDLDQVELLIYDQRVPEDRRVLYALEFLTGMRTGEAAARRWKDWDLEFRGDLGRLVAADSYDSKSRSLNATTKTGVEKWLPVHPALAEILAAWKAEGFERFLGRQPQPEDPIVPASWAFKKRPDGKPYPTFRHHSASWRAFQDDLELLGIPAQRHYESRATFINLAEAGGATDDDVSTITHAGKRRSKDLYRRSKGLWPKVCRAVRFIKVRRPGTPTDESSGAVVTPPVENLRDQPEGAENGADVGASRGRLQPDMAVPDIRQAHRQVAAGKPLARTADVTPAATPGGGSVADFLALAGQLARDAAARGDTAAARALLESALKALDLPAAPKAVKRAR